MKHSIILSVILLFSFFSNAQIIEPIKWSFDAKQTDKEIELLFTAEIEDGWHLYDTDLPEGGPLPTQIVYADSSVFEFISQLEKQPEPVEKFDKTFQMNLRYFESHTVLTQKIRLKETEDPLELNGYVVFMGCDDEVCLPPDEVEFSFKLNGFKEANELIRI